MPSPSINAMMNTHNVQDTDASSRMKKSFFRHRFRAFSQRWASPTNGYKEDAAYDTYDNRSSTTKSSFSLHSESQPSKQLQKPTSRRLLWRKNKFIVQDMVLSDTIATESSPCTPGAQEITKSSSISPLSWRRKSTKKGSCRPGLSHIKSALKILAAVGDGVAPVPGLKGVAGIALEIVRVIELVRNNRKEAEAVAIRAFELIQMIWDVLSETGGSQEDIPRFILHFETSLLDILSLMNSLVIEDIRWYKRILNCELTKENITDCNDLLDRHVERFQLEVALRSSQALKQQHVEALQRQETLLAQTNLINLTLQEQQDQLRREIGKACSKMNVAVNFFLTDDLANGGTIP